jgi:tetratricopeptide (TPR) repeat protein
MRVLKFLSFSIICSLIMSSCGGGSSSQKGDAYFQNEQFEEAIIAYENFLETKPKNLKALYNKGRAHEELEDYDKAEESFKKALQVDPKNSQILLSLSNLYHKKKSYELSLMYADNAVEVSGATAMAYFMKVRALHQLGNVDEAMREYNAAIKMNPNYGQALYYRGMLNRLVDKNQQACADFRKAVENDFALAQDALTSYCQ